MFLRNLPAGLLRVSGNTSFIELDRHVVVILLLGNLALISFCISSNFIFFASGPLISAGRYFICSHFLTSLSIAGDSGLSPTFYIVFLAYFMTVL